MLVVLSLSLSLSKIIVQNIDFHSHLPSKVNAIISCTPEAVSVGGAQSTLQAIPRHRLKSMDGLWNGWGQLRTNPKTPSSFMQSWAPVFSSLSWEQGAVRKHWHQQRGQDVVQLSPLAPRWHSAVGQGDSQRKNKTKIFPPGSLPYMHIKKSGSTFVMLAIKKWPFFPSSCIKKVL